MTGLVIISLLGTLILVLGIRLVTQSRNSPTVTIDDYRSARETLDSVFVETETIRRVFSAEDAEFIARSATADVRRLFLDERKRLAMQWFRRTRRYVARLMHIHLRLASYTYDPNPGLELKLTTRYLSFMVISQMAVTLLWLLGPFKATRVISYTLHAAGNFCTTFSLRLDRVNPAQLRSARESLVH